MNGKVVISERRTDDLCLDRLFFLEISQRFERRRYQCEEVHPHVLEDLGLGLEGNVAAIRIAYKSDCIYISSIDFCGSPSMLALRLQWTYQVGPACIEDSFYALAANENRKGVEDSCQVAPLIERNGALLAADFISRF